MKNAGIIKKEATAFILVDIQAKLAPAMNDFEKVLANASILIKASEILNIPLIVTEQYPEGLGRTINQLLIPSTVKPIEKLSFSCFLSEDFVLKIKEQNIKTIVLFGIEAHVCVLQTALNAIDNGLNVHVVVEPTEMVLFQLLEKAGSAEFKLISKLIR